MGAIRRKRMKNQTVILFVFTLTMIVHSQTPSYIALYSRAGAPISLYLLPHTDTIKAGDSFKLVAKVFDENGNWLSKYEDSLSYSGMLTWRLTKPAGALNATSGYQNIYTASSSDTVSIIVSLNTGNVILTDRIKLMILPGFQHHLCIEDDETPDPIISNPSDTVRLSSSDSAKLVYIVIRDRYSNLVRFASDFIVSGNDTNIAKVEMADSLNGKITVLRSTSSGVTRMIVSQAFLIPDTCYIKIEARNPTITYMPMRISNRIGNTGNKLKEYYLINGKRFNSSKYAMHILVKTGNKKGIAPRIQINK